MSYIRKDCWFTYLKYLCELRFGPPALMHTVPLQHADVVVATIQTLHAKATKRQSKLPFQPAAVVVDEAHRSIAPTYTGVLAALGISTRVKEPPFPLIGLTATPFRTAGDETRALVARYGRNRLDHGLFPDDDALEFLFGQGVLAKPAFGPVLDSGIAVVLQDREIEEFEQFGVYPRSVEQRLGRDASRAQLVTDAVVDLDPAWRTLVYAPSVEGAKLIAAQLRMAGRSANAITDATGISVRRRLIEEFGDHKGPVQVLTNYRILAEGFDAPRARCIIIARPIFSPNLYQQIVGRGLRGTAFGGSDECLIINVADNDDRFGDRLAFREFEAFW